MRITCVQMNMGENRPEENFLRAEALLRAAWESERPDVLVLPETWNTGFAPSRVNPACGDENGERTTERMSALARELNVNIVAGSVTVRREGKLYNTALVFDRTGERIASYDKTHLFSPMREDRVYEKGNALCRFTLDNMTCGLIICYDLRFPELTRRLALPGLDLLFVVSQWPKARAMHLSVLSRARAIENQLFLALCNSCGTAGKTQYGGGSAIIDPFGNVLAGAGEEETVISAEADPSVLADIRSSIPVFADRRPELY